MHSEVPPELELGSTGTTRPWSRVRRAVHDVLDLLVSRRVHVHGVSMHPLIEPGDTVLVNRLAYVGHEPERGDVVLASRRGGASASIIKIVAGLGGETIRVFRDRLWVNDRLVDFPQPMVGALPGRWRLQSHEYFLLSYAVAVGTDSRTFGAVPRSALKGRVWYVCGPRSRVGRFPGCRITLSQATIYESDIAR